MISDDFKQILKQAEGASGGHKEEKIIPKVQLIVFKLDGEEYGVLITDLKEIIKITDITPVPNAPVFVKGVLNLRGRIVIAIDLEKLFSLYRENKIVPKHILVTEIGNSLFGAIVDEVSEIIWVPKDNIKDAPDLVADKIKRDYISGLVVFDKGDDTSKAKEVESRIITILDFKKIFNEKELLSFGDKEKDNIN